MTTAIAYVVPAFVAVALAMAWAHAHPWFEDSHSLARYAWGVGWIVAAVGGFAAFNPQAQALATFAALCLFAGAAGAGTAFGYLSDVVRRYVALREHTERRYEQASGRTE